MTDALAAAFGLQLQAPETFGARFRAESVGEVDTDILVRVVGCRVGFQRQGLRVDEGGDPAAEVFDVVGQGEIHWIGSLERGDEMAAIDGQRRAGHVAASLGAE